MVLTWVSHELQSFEGLTEAGGLASRMAPSPGWQGGAGGRQGSVPVTSASSRAA